MRRSRDSTFIISPPLTPLTLPHPPSPPRPPPLHVKESSVLLLLLVVEERTGVFTASIQLNNVSAAIATERSSSQQRPLPVQWMSLLATTNEKLPSSGSSRVKMEEQRWVGPGRRASASDRTAPSSVRPCARSDWWSGLTHVCGSRGSNRGIKTTVHFHIKLHQNSHYASARVVAKSLLLLLCTSMHTCTRA